MKQFQLDPNEVARRSKEAERQAEEEFKGAGLGWEPLDVERSRSRPEGCILDAPNGDRLCLVEVKRVESGGVGEPLDGPAAPAMLSDLDPRLPDGRIRRFPAIPPAVRRDQDDAVKKYLALVKDRPEFHGLPYIIAFARGPRVRLDLVDRRMPRHREISGLLFFERGRRRRESLQNMPRIELERRMREGDESGLPPAEEVEWRLIPNPYAWRPMPLILQDKSLVAWPDDPPWPDHLPEKSEEVARKQLATLPQNERVVLDAVYGLFGCIDVVRSEHAPAQPVLELLVTRGLATRETATRYVLTTQGLTLGLVHDLDRRAAEQG